MKTKFSLRVAAVFSFMVFLILTVTMIFMGVIAFLSLKLGLFGTQNLGLLLINFGIVSISVGTFFSMILGKRPVQAIVEISDATKEIAKGNFDVKLNENIRAAELRTMAHNFNVMTRELAGTELFRNDFVENVSHEFKTPLSAIEGYVTLLQKKSLSEEKRAEYTERILFNTKRLSALTGNILLLSRLENQEMDIKKECYSLDEQIRESILMFEPQWSAKNLEFDIDLDTVDYCGNVELLAHVWQNLLGNAVKFVSANGMIRVILRQKETGTEISIVDNGIGMSEEVVKRVYEKFYQGDVSRTSAGNGLGLALVKRIVDLHGGTITVSSKVQKGTTFTVNLPSA